MNFINKSRISKPQTTIIGLICIAIVIIIFQGCNKEEELNSSNMVAISNSNEFEEYIAANIELFAVCQKANSMLKDTTLMNAMKV